VLLDEVLGAFEGRELRTFVDGTLGAGGHSAAVAARHPEAALLVGIDQDPAALEIAAGRLRGAAGPSAAVHLHRGNFRDMRRVLSDLGVFGQVSGILLDLGVSSMQLDRGERGFSFRFDAPLDMRMDPAAPLSARDVVNSWPEHEIARVFRDYGEERFWRQLAARVVDARGEGGIETTGDLLRALGMEGGRGRAGGRGGRGRGRGGRGGKGIHPATRVFQGLRIAVNDELGVLSDVLPDAIDALAPGGRLAVISFHSLEDRLVKRAFNRAAGRGSVFDDGPGEELWRPGSAEERGPRSRRQSSLEGVLRLELEGERPASVRLVNRKPLEAGEEETRANPRSRTAKLRVVEKL